MKITVKKNQNFTPIEVVFTIVGIAFLSLIVLASIWLMQLTQSSKWKYQQLVHEVITECEKTLPRDQKCVLIAEPEGV